MDPKQFLDILNVAEKLKCMPRHCYTSSGRRESVAEHSWRVSLMAMLLSGEEEYRQLDMNKVIRMCLIHDLGEAFTGDIPTFLKNSSDADVEDDLLDRWVKTFPEPQREEWLELLKEMDALETPEAKLYKSLDRLEALIAHNESDILTWLPLEYGLQLTYGQKDMAFSPYLRSLRKEVDEWSCRKIQEEGVMRTLENEYLRIAVSDRGAELSSLVSVKSGKEYLFNADPKYWGYHAPVLFPFVGKVYRGEYHYQGKTYHIGQHGFARTSMFKPLLNEAAEEGISKPVPEAVSGKESTLKIVHVLEDREGSRRIYPFPFRFTVTHSLDGNAVVVHWNVFNPSETDSLYFSVGAHPAFRTPVADGALKKECYVHFEDAPDPEYILINAEEAAADPEHRYQLETEEGYLKLEDHLFDIDTFIFEDGQIRNISLCGPDKVPYVTVRCDGFPYFGLWTKSDDAPFVCLEPWFGRIDDVGFEGDLSGKKGILTLAPGAEFDAEYRIEITE